MEFNISLQLGDIIEIESPANLQLHNRQYFIEYIERPIEAPTINPLPPISPILSPNIATKNLAE